MNDFLINEAVEKFKEKAVSVLPGIIDSIYLYGSCARGDYDEDSDIDVLVILDCADDMIFPKSVVLSHVASDIGLDTDTLVSCQARTKADWGRRKNISPYYQNIIREGVRVYR